MKLLTPFILASRSPRRQKLLEQLGLHFSIEVSHTEEIIPENTPPADIVRQLALEKASSIAENNPEALTLGADTIVVLDGTILGKPAHPEEARTMLQQLSGQSHVVFTGLALIHPPSNRKKTAYEATIVTFAEMNDREIDAYVATGSPLDKAGAYGIQDDQGALYISHIDGDYYNVVGLPLHRLYRLMKEEFSDLIEV